MNTITNNISSFTSTSYSNSSGQNKPDNLNNKNTTQTKIEANAIYDIAKKYDVKNMTIDEVISMSDKLYKSGEISLLESSILSLDSSHLNKGSTYLSKKDPNGNYNMIEEFKARVKLSEKFADENSIKNNSDILKLLIKLDGLKAGPLDIMV